MDNLTPAEAIKKAEEMGGLGIESYHDEDFNPTKNPNVISLIKMKDGNWKAFGAKNGKIGTVRGSKPEDALIEFLTSS